MYCILVTGIPAAGKSVVVECLGEHYSILVISQD